VDDSVTTNTKHQSTKSQSVKTLTVHLNYLKYFRTLRSLSKQVEAEAASVAANFAVFSACATEKRQLRMQQVHCARSSLRLLLSCCTWQEEPSCFLEEPQHRGKGFLEDRAKSPIDLVESHKREMETQFH
jgi:hypothetical protein